MPEKRRLLISEPSPNDPTVFNGEEWMPVDDHNAFREAVGREVERLRGIANDCTEAAAEFDGHHADKALIQASEATATADRLRALLQEHGGGDGRAVMARRYEFAGVDVREPLHPSQSREVWVELWKPDTIEADVTAIDERDVEPLVEAARNFLNADGQATTEGEALEAALAPFSEEGS